MGATDGFLTLGGSRHRCRTTGPDDAPAVLALHATGHDARSWDEVARRLAPGLRLVALDLRGHGETTAQPDLAFDVLRDDVLAAAQALRLSSFGLIGHSLGGSVAALVAEARPAALRWLVLEDTPPPWRSDPPIGFPPEPPEHLAVGLPAWRQIMAQLAAPEPAWWDDLRRIEVPTLFVGGGASSHVPQERLRAAGRLVPDARLVTIDAGHLVHQQAPEAFAAAVLGFLRGLG